MEVLYNAEPIDIEKGCRRKTTCVIHIKGNKEIIVEITPAI
jgi:hypothetical protein